MYQLNMTRSSTQELNVKVVLPVLAISRELVVIIIVIILQPAGWC
jgi:hypothetical protein